MLIEQHIAALDGIMTLTPENDPQFAEATTMAVLKMTMVLAGRENGDLASEAKGEAFIDALEDVPSWAVQEAMRKWHRAEYGPKHDYKWQPAPATLRELAMLEVYRAKGIRRKLKEVLAAEPLIEFSVDHEADMRAKVKAALRIRRA